MEKGKKILLTLVAFILIGGATAYTIGQIVSQQQFDGIDFSARDFNVTITDKEKNNDRIIIKYSYDTLHAQSDGTFKVVQKEKLATYHRNQWNECRNIDGNTIAECKVVARKHIKIQILKTKTDEIARLDSQKSLEAFNEISANDIDLNKSEIN